uniref:DNA packaging terminase subunit 1 n=1 Tax=Human herpesvirus 2 TaxID=10310 RepID=A0A0Y0RPN0_HHV2|nr:DNA packaging terminase subunit 1 [Human alphaherpesvirus 2]
MFGQQLASDVQQYLERLEKQRQQKVGVDEASAGLTLGGDALRVPFLDFATATPKRHQTVVPGVGTLHDCCEHSPLFSAVARRLLFNSLVPAQLRGRDFGGDHTAKLEFLAPELVRAVARLRFRECAPEDAVPQRNAYYSVLNTFQALHRSEAFRQLVHFVRDFAQLLKTSFRASSLAETTGPPKKRAKVDVATHGQTYGTLELFQKMILMHATYFLAAVLLGDHAEQVNTFLRLVFEIPLFSDTAVRHFRQRATVFLVPRRHGKTWFLVPLIALSLASFRGIKIGYTAHIRKATEPVFDEIDACLRGWFGSSRVDHVKGETISFSFPDGSRSTIVFASSHNTNVSTPSSRGACFPGAALPVFLVPRRHGKTWFLVPLIALSLASFRGIKIGYTAHIRKATEPVFDEIDACLRGWFGSSRVDHVKGETISFSFPDGSRSTIVFASSHNTNVSTPSSRGACFPGAALPEIDRQTNTARRECGTTRPQPPPPWRGEALLFICNRTMRLWPRPARPRGSSLQTGGWYTMTERRGATRRWSGG